MTLKQYRCLFLATIAQSVAAPSFACDGFAVHNPYARSSTIMSTSGAAFMVLHNHGTTNCRVVSVHSDISERAELHTHTFDANGVTRMVHLEEGLLLPAGGEVLLQRGGNHVMFLGLNRPMEEGAEISVTLVFEDGSEATLSVPIDNQRQPMQVESGSMGAHAHEHSNGT